MGHQLYLKSHFETKGFEMNRHHSFLCAKVNSLQKNIKEKMAMHDSSSDNEYKNSLYSEVRKMEKALSGTITLLKAEEDRFANSSGGVYRRTYSIRTPKFKTKTILISNDGLHKKRKEIKLSNQKCFDSLRENNDTVVVFSGRRKKIPVIENYVPLFKYSSGMDVFHNGKRKRVFNNIQETSIDEDILDIYHEEQMNHFPQDKRMMEKDMKLKSLRFAEKVCGLLFNNEKMLNKGYS